jgi:asparagine synthetase B (glutamine-hydrolysing)
MLTKNNWITSNIYDRAFDKSVDFRVSLNPYEFKDINFIEASEYTCHEIYKDYQNLYLALSGGMDSEYVLRAFYRAGISITPIIVCCGNEKENQYAYNVCNELQIVPIVLKISEEDFLRKYYEIYSKINGVGYNTTQVLFAAEYAQNVDGMLITGNHFIGDGDELIADEHYATLNEWDFYTDFFSYKNIDFFLYTIEIAYSMMPRKYVKWNMYKHELYGIEYRNKEKAIYSLSAKQILQRMSSSLISKQHGCKWTKQKFLSIFEKYKIGDVYGTTNYDSHKR